MGKKTVTKETTEFDAAEATSGSNGGNGTHRDDEVDPAQMERAEALRTKYQYAAKRNRIAIEELEQTKKEKEQQKEEKVVDETDDLIRTMTKQLKLKSITKLLKDDDDKPNGKPSEIADLVKEMKEAFSYLDRKMENLERGKGDERAMALQHQQSQQQAQQSQQQFQMMMAMMNRQDPNQAMMQSLIVKMMDQKSSLKDFLPMMSQVQMMGMQQSAELEKSRMAIMQEVVLHALSAGEKDWESMSLPEKAEFLMGMMKKGVGFAADKITEYKSRKYDPDKKKAIENGKEPQKIGLNPPADPSQPSPTTQTSPDADGTTPPATEVDDLIPIIRDRVNRILKVVETEMRLGSDPYVVFEEIEKLYFGLPEVMRNKIESEANPMVLVSAIEPYAEKALLDRITNMAISDQHKAEWLKHFHQAVLGIDEGDEEEPDGDEEGDEGDEQPEAPSDKPTA
jgi:hypothetical protein